MTENILPFKVVLCGESAVGKSSIGMSRPFLQFFSKSSVLRFCKGKFDPDIDSTIAAAFFQKVVECESGKAKLDIWDTAGQEKFKSLTPMYFRGAHGALVVYDITSMDSFKKACSTVKELRKSQKNKKLVIGLAGNKVDLETNRTVDKKKGEDFSKKNDLIFCEMSAKVGDGVPDMFKKITVDLLKLPKLYMDSDDDSDVPKVLPKAETKKKGCCVIQ